MKKFIFIIFIIQLSFAYSQQNEFFIKLAQKDLATFNDGITLIRLLYNERDDEANFVKNIIWAAQKKLFRVTIPIKADTVNPVLTRREFASWICKIFSGKNGIAKSDRILKYTAYRICVNLGIMSKGRGAFDSFTGRELLDTFSYLDYYVRYKNIKPKTGDLDSFDDDYDHLPEWRKRLYKELDEQREKEKEIRKQRKEKRKKEREEKMNKNNQTEKKIDSVKEKKIEE